MTNIARLKEAVHSGCLTAFTKAVGDLAEEAGFQLRAPYTVIKELKANEEGEGFTVQFTARTCLHYSCSMNEGFVLAVEFSGRAYADSPNPPIHELFNAATIDSILVYGYGRRWKGKNITTPTELAKNLEVTSSELIKMELEEFLQAVEAA